MKEYKIQQDKMRAKMEAEERAKKEEYRLRALKAQ